MTRLEQMTPYFEKGVKQVEIAKLFGVSTSRVSEIRREWKRAKYTNVTYAYMVKATLIRYGYTKEMGSKCESVLERNGIDSDEALKEYLYGYSKLKRAYFGVGPKTYEALAKYMEVSNGTRIQNG